MAIFVWPFIKCKTLVTERKDPLEFFTNMCQSLYAMFMYPKNCLDIVTHSEVTYQDAWDTYCCLLILREYVAIFNQSCCFRHFRRCKTWYKITLQRGSPWNRLCGRDRISKSSFTPISGKIFDFAKNKG